MPEHISSKSILVSPEFRLFEHTYSEFVYPKHFHETYVIEVIEDGTEDFFWNGTNYKNIKKDSLVLINPGEVHTGGGGSINNSKLVCRVFYPELRAWENILGESSAISKSESAVRFKSPVVVDKKIVASIKRMYSLNEEDKNDLFIKELYNEVMLDLLTKHMSSTISFDENVQRYLPAIERGKEYINDNLADKLVLENIAKAAYISPFHYLRIFKKITGITLHQYVLSLRIERAKTLLMQNRDICDTFNQVGFLNHVHFTKVFGKMTGFTPKQYKGMMKV